MKRYAWNETIRTIVIAVVLAVTFRSFLFEPFHIPSGSMKSNLLVGDYLFVSKFSYGYSRYSFPFGLPLFEGRVGGGAPQRGDVVVFRPPPSPRVDFIKRIMALPGDSIQLRGGIVYINGSPLPREPVDEWEDRDEYSGLKTMMPRLHETLPEGKIVTILKARQFGNYDDTPIFIVPPKHYFMMGDNRDHSEDSRSLAVGFVPEENIVGRARIILFSVDEDFRLFNPLTWPGSLRFNRFFQWID